MFAQGYLDSLTSIVAIDVRGAIGCRNQLPWRLKSDMAFFKSKTIDNAVVMGRKTYDSLGGKCLPNRSNVVLSHNNVLFDSTNDCRLALSVDEALFLLSAFNRPEAYVIGGAVTYREFAPFVDRYLVTIVDHEVRDADTYLSQSILSTLRTWHREEIARFPSEAKTDEFAFAVYEVVAPDAEERAAERHRRIENFRSKIGQSSKTIKRRTLDPHALQGAFAF